MNAPGQKFVDDFASAELTPYVPLFLRSAQIVYAHTLLQRYHGTENGPKSTFSFSCMATDTQPTYKGHDP